MHIDAKRRLNPRVSPQLCALQHVHEGDFSREFRPTTVSNSSVTQKCCGCLFHRHGTFPLNTDTRWLPRTQSTHLHLPSRIIGALQFCRFHKQLEGTRPESMVIPVIKSACTQNMSRLEGTIRPRVGARFATSIRKRHCKSDMTELFDFIAQLKLPLANKQRQNETSVLLLFLKSEFRKISLNQGKSGHWIGTRTELREHKIELTINLRLSNGLHWNCAGNIARNDRKLQIWPTKSWGNNDRRNS